MDGAVDRVHATAIAVANRAILIRGPSGAGKSDLAFRCLAVTATHLVPCPARLIADDQVVLTREQDSVIASAAAQLFGKIEVRGIGILDVEAGPPAPVVLIADLTPSAAYERYPDPWPVTQLLGLSVPLLSIRPYEASAALKLLAALESPLLPAVKPIRDVNVWKPARG